MATYTFDPVAVAAEAAKIKANEAKAVAKSGNKLVGRVIHDLEAGRLSPDKHAALVAVLDGDKEALVAALNSGPLGLGDGSGSSTSSSSTPTPTGRRSEFAQVYLMNPDGTVQVNDDGNPVPDASIMQMRWDDTAGIAKYELVQITLPDGTLAMAQRPSAKAPAPSPSPAPTTDPMTQASVSVFGLDKHDTGDKITPKEVADNPDRYGIVGALDSNGNPEKVVDLASKVKSTRRRWGFTTEDS